MIIKVVKLVSVFAWCAVAVAMATPASAEVYTMQTGNYATCSAAYTVANFEIPDCSPHLYYSQNIRLTGTACSAGTCSESGSTYSTIRYPVGRKPAELVFTCAAGYNCYGLGTCAC
jgi:hypothetical protein